MSEIRNHPAKPSLASNLSKLMSGIKSTDTLIDKPTSVLTDKSTGTLVDKPTDGREESPAITGTTNKKPQKRKLINKGFYIEPLDFAALSFYAVSKREDKSAIIRRLIRENIPKHFYEMAKANQKDGE